MADEGRSRGLRWVAVAALLALLLLLVAWALRPEVEPAPAAGSSGAPPAPSAALAPPVAPIESGSPTELPVAPAQAQPAPGRPTTEGRAEPAPAARGPRGPTLRSVRGLVRDRATGAPIAGAAVRWFDPNTAVRDGPVKNEDWPALARYGWTRTDEAGRFELPRLAGTREPRGSLRAVAHGYAAASCRPGLREEVVIDLERPGALVVQLEGEWKKSGFQGGIPPAPLVLEPVPPDPARRAEREEPEDEERLPSGQVARSTWRLEGLSAGHYRVLLHTRELATATVTAGQTATVAIHQPAWVWMGSVPGATDGATLVLIGQSQRRPWRLRGGRFACNAPEGACVAVLEEGTSWRRLPGVVQVAAGALVLPAPRPAAPVKLVLRRGGQPYLSQRLRLVGRDPEGDRFELSPDPGLEAHVGDATAGRYAVLDDWDLVGEVQLPAPGPVVLDVDPFLVRVRFQGLSGLRPDERVRGRLQVELDLALAWPSDRPRLLDVVLGPEGEGPILAFGHPGPYLLHGETEVGPFEARLELGPTTREVTISLPD